MGKTTEKIVMRTTVLLRERDVKKLKKLQKQSGLNVCEIIRALIQRTEKIEEPRIVTEH